MGTKIGLLIVLVFAVSSLMIVNSAQAQTVLPTPEFVATYYGQPYTVPATTLAAVEPIAGNITVTNRPSFYSPNGSIEISIKNMPFKTYNSSLGVYFDIIVRDEAGGEWKSLYQGSTPQGMPLSDSIYNTAYVSGLNFSANDSVQVWVWDRIYRGHYETQPNNLVASANSKIQTLTFPASLAVPVFVPSKPAPTAALPKFTVHFEGQPMTFYPPLPSQ
jgi:hypothetical protein